METLRIDAQESPKGTLRLRALMDRLSVDRTSVGSMMDCLAIALKVNISTILGVKSRGPLRPQYSMQRGYDL